MVLKLGKHIKLSLSLLMTMAIAGSCTAATNPTTVTTQYQSSSEDFPNPERGLFQAFDPIGDTPAPALQLSNLQKVRADNMALIRSIYLLSEFRGKPISQSYLDMISNDLKTARNAGVKVIIRFAYTWLADKPDAPRDIVVSHLDQLKPILQANSDVIAYMEAGFIGAWGQWNRSSNKLIDNWTLGVTDDSKAIFSKILSVLPTTRMVLLPYPKQKMEIFNTTSSLTSAEAFSATNKARTGVHNDGFLAGPDDMGFYTYNNVERDKKFLNLDNLYVPHGGETASNNSAAQSYITCDNALSELARMRWSALNSFKNGYGDGWGVLKKWETDGCMPEIKQRLGYRFRLINSITPDKVKPAGTFSMKFQIANDGWASPFNPRNLEVILRNRQTGQVYYLPVSEAVRMWMPGNIKEVNVVGGIPSSMPSGEYQVLLNLPDPASKLSKRPEYSIRLANQNVWEASTGYNSLLRSVIIDSNAAGDTYLGAQVFKSR